MAPESPRWVIEPPDPEAARALASRLGVPLPIGSVLLRRGVRDEDAARAFLEPRLNDLHDPGDLRDMDRAVARTVAAVERGERICVHGDYDADGMTSTALLAAFFEALGHPVDTFVPDRLRDGYGIHPDRLRAIVAAGARLVITVDCGTTAFEEAALARSLGADLLVLDHHEPGDALPEAAAVVNPHRADCGSSFKDLAAVGVAFYFAGAVRRALVASGRLRPGQVDLRPLLDLVAIGTIADVVPLLGDNRVFATAGLKVLNESPRLGLTALKAVAGISGRTVTAGMVAFQLAPRLNAVGRLSDARAAVDLLRATDPEAAKRHADVLDRENLARRQVEEQVLGEARAAIEASGGPAHRMVVVAGQGWHHGVVGIVASRLVEAYRRPALVIGVEDGVGRGSCRSVRGFDVGRALASVSHLLLRCGGHPMAAGLAVEADRIPELAEALHALADREVPEEALQGRLDVEGWLRLDEVDAALVAEAARLQPHGVGNPEPVFAVAAATVRDVRRVGRDLAHLQLVLAAGDRTVPAIWFGGGPAPLVPGDVVDAAFTLSTDERTGAPRLKVRDVRRLQT